MAAEQCLAAPSDVALLDGQCVRVTDGPHQGLQPSPGLANKSLEPAAVLAAIESLYSDELKPYGRILRKRLAEQAAAAGLGAVDVDMRRLRGICESRPWAKVVPEGGGDWSALLLSRSPHFVDVYSPRDEYPGELWAAAAAYFEGLREPDMTLPGGRYACAQALMARGLPFLSGRSLGQVCHVVQLAISQKKLLGYLNGAVVPYCRSQSMVKERCAEKQRPCTTAARGTMAIATWDTLRGCLQEILASASASRLATVPLSNVKRLFRSRYHIELSETALGHAKLSELLQDQRLRDLCALQLRGHGYVVVPLAVPPDAEGPKPAGQQPCPPPRNSRRSEAAAPRNPQGQQRRCLPLSDGARQPIRLPPAALPRQVGGRHTDSQPQRTEVNGAPGSGPGGASPQGLGRGSSGCPLSPTALSKDGRVGSMVLNTFIHAMPAPVTPTAGAARRSSSLPKDLGSGKSAWEAACHALSFMPTPVRARCGLGAAGGGTAFGLRQAAPAGSGEGTPPPRPAGGGGDGSRRLSEPVAPSQNEEPSTECPCLRCLPRLTMTGAPAFASVEPTEDAEDSRCRGDAQGGSKSSSKGAAQRVVRLAELL